VPERGGDVQVGRRVWLRRDRGEIYKAGEGRHMELFRVAAAVPSAGPELPPHPPPLNDHQKGKRSHASGAARATLRRVEHGNPPKPARPEIVRAPHLRERRGRRNPQCWVRASDVPELGTAAGRPSTSRGLCSGLGGLVEIRSSRGAGTSVTLRLPFARS